MNSDLLNYYIGQCDEDNRLLRDKHHSLEFISSMHFLKKYLPKNSKVLDCCAGTGIYAFELAELGHRVTACDLTDKHVELIKNKNSNNLLCGVYQGNVLDMSRFADNDFDAVLCMGALYHLQSEQERKNCVKECLRIVKSGGIFAFAYVNRHAVMINKILKHYASERLEEIRTSGINGVFYTMDFDEQNKLISGFDVEKLTDIGVDGCKELGDKANALTDEEFSTYANYHLSVCDAPSILDMSMHGLWIGKKM